MKKFIIFLLIFSSFSIVTALSVYASPVRISIESYNKTIVRGMVEASSVREALLKLCSANNLSVILNADGSEIRSVGDVENNVFTVYDCWQGYILRGGKVVQSPSILNEEIVRGDDVIIYYGHISDTKIMTDFSYTKSGLNLVFGAASKAVIWYEDNGEWVSGETTQFLSGVKVNITEPGKTRKIVQTNNKGHAEIPLNTPGVYKIYADGYRMRNNPNIVRTLNYIYFNSDTGKGAITRAEACAFFVQAFDLTPKGTFKTFADVFSSTPYSEQIKTAASNNLVSGYENGYFMPDDTVNLLQLGIMLSKLYPDAADTQNLADTNAKTDTNAQPDSKTAVNEDAEGDTFTDLPQWALPYARKIKTLGLFGNLGYDWFRPVTNEDLAVLFSSVNGTF
ncbi:MAG: S-layer homology domain-containing protein [Clostridiales bacterium]|jgi:hypothetical protein|nr:S-layer homology domain-containing protein [Clostridiales bacterium]